MREDNTKRQWDFIEENFKFDYAAGIKWALRTLGDRWRAYKYALRNKYFFPNKRKEEILAEIPSKISPVEWTTFVNHYMDPKIKKQCLQNKINREKLQISHAGGSKSNARRANQMEKISEHLPEDQERAATEGVPSKVLAHPDDAIGKIYGPENEKRVRGFSSAICPGGFDKSKRIFGASNSGDTNNVSQQHVEHLEMQLQQAKDQVAAFHRFLLQKYGDESGKVIAYKERIEVIDEENKLVRFKVFDDDINQHYKDLKVTLQVNDEKNDERGCVTWTIEYEKINDDVEAPYGFVELLDIATKDIVLHLLKA
ncbi:hypothetical protein PIB30_017251 [Stylosanthes scabra]|uniref:Bet v I/Major latex protein domain-containing protein n=1 Tax=Stylosanthes scabra TaxID=79078 RepID=A0ABU6Q7D1_9FABA|nr:hypothetical protein [Stylosanthes scabra]